MNTTRKYWLDTMLKIVDPFLDALSRDCLRKEMPIECKYEIEVCQKVTYLEGFGRILVGMAPWIGSKATGEEEKLRQKYAALVRKCLSVAVDPNANDKMNFSELFQPIVDAAFLAEGILRAPHELWDPLDDITKERLLNAMRETRTRRPSRNNWLLFSAMIECLLHYAKASDWDPMRIDYALLKHSEWYKGDGWYGDGNDFHFDYYNSFVIQPMLLDVITEVKDEQYKEWAGYEAAAWKRASHYATHQEHLISPEGTYPLIGRSLAYRFGAFHVLAMAAYHHKLEDGIAPAQVRCALTAVMKNMMAFDNMFDENGWLQIGVCGHQPDMGEEYISTGSLYLCSEVFLPLGLSEDDPFWSDADMDWTMKSLWKGNNHKCEHALYE